MEIRLIAVDLDGTLFTTEGTPAPGGLEALKRANRHGVKVVVVTARRYLTIDTTYRDLGFPDPLICWDGAEIYKSYDRETWHTWAIPWAPAGEILSFADEEGLELSVGYSSTLYFKRRVGQDGEPPPGVKFTISYLETLKDELPLRLLTDDARALDALSDFCSGLPKGSCRVQKYFDSNGLVISFV